MKWKEILRKDDHALLQSESDTQYAVVSGYDPTQPEDQQWSHGTYFCYWKDESEKASCLSSALDAFKAKSYADYIPNVKRTEPKRYVFVNWYGEQLGYEDVDDLEEAKKIAVSLQCEVYDRKMEEPVYNCWRGDL